MKTILTTGSNGLLGKKITEKVLVEGRVNLIATSVGVNRYPVEEGYEYVEMDILNPEQVKEVIEKYRPDAVIHTAAMTNVDDCEADKALCLRLNVDAVATILSICEEKNIQLIHLSTDFVFDGKNGPYREEDAVNPVSYYGESKVMAEELIKNSKANYAILRTILVYGISHNMSRSNIVLWAKGALEKASPINVVNDQWRMPTLAEDLAEACLLAVEHNARGIYHISGKDYMSIADLVRKVADYWKLDQSYINEISSASLNQTAKRPVKTGFVLDKAIKDLGYNPHSFEEGLLILEQQMGVSPESEV
jgi:dTDP-4-dehydrorhamnose reductase